MELSLREDSVHTVVMDWDKEIGALCVTVFSKEDQLPVFALSFNEHASSVALDAFYHPWAYKNNNQVCYTIERL